MDGTGGTQYILEEHLIIWAETGPYAEIGPWLLQMWKYDAHWLHQSVRIRLQRTKSLANSGLNFTDITTVFT